MGADADGDGRAEIAATGDSAVFLFRYDDANGDGEVDLAGNWPQPRPGLRTLGKPIFTPAMGNLDFDPRLEIVAVTDSGAVYAWDDDGVPFAGADSSGLILSFPPSSAPAWPAIPADLDSDSQDELFLATRDGRLHAYTFASGVAETLFAPRILPVAPDSGETFFPSLAFGDLAGNEALDGVVAFIDADSIRVQVFDGEGRRPWRRAYPLPSLEAKRAYLSLADLDRSPENNDLEIVLATDRGLVTAIDRHGAPLPGWPVTLLPEISGPPAFGDLDGDGLLEVVIASGGHRLDVLNYNATSVPGWPVFIRLADYPNQGNPIPAPAVADVDGDGKQDVVCGGIDFTVRAFDGEGKEIAGFPVVTGAAVRSTPAILDANDDGRLDFFVGSEDGYIYGKILSGMTSGQNPAWGMFGAGPKMHGSFEESRLPIIAGGAGVLRGPMTIYPNPALPNQDEITIRYTLGSDLSAATGIEISLYNLAGELMARIPGTAFPNTENVVRMSSKNLASGAYLCSIKARSGSRVDSHTEKLAVIR
jgi:hypothetical protein